MEISVRVSKGDFNAAALARRVNRWTEHAVKGATKYLHRSAERSIRTSAYPSKPGRAPHTREGALRNAVRSKSVGIQGYVGITPDMGSPMGLSRIAAIHEYGGKIPYMGRRLAIGQVGPIARLDGAGRRRKRDRIGNLYQFAMLRTAAQVNRARRNFTKFYGAPVKDTADYPERSFLRSSLAYAMPYIMRTFFRQ